MRLRNREEGRGIAYAMQSILLLQDVELHLRVVALPDVKHWFER